MYYIGAEINGNSITVAIIDNEMHLLHVFGKKSIMIEESRLSEKISELIKSLLKEEKIDKSSVFGLGIGYFGECAEKNKFINEIKKSTGIKTFLFSVANAAVYGEFVAGEVNNVNNQAVIILNENIDTGIIINKELIYGNQCGHVIIDVDGADCYCGRMGCFEAYSSVTGLIRMTREALRNYPSSSLNELVEKDGKISARTAFNAAKLEDEAGVEVLDNYVKYLTAGLNNIINIIKPDVIYLGGEIIEEGDFLIKTMQEHFKKDITICRLGEDAVILGAAMLCKTNN